MSNPNLDDYIKQGVYGAKETKPEERREFLGTLRERVVIALKQSQVLEDGIYEEVEIIRYFIFWKDRSIL